MKLILLTSLVLLNGCTVIHYHGIEENRVPARAPYPKIGYADSKYQPTYPTHPPYPGHPVTNQLRDKP